MALSTTLRWLWPLVFASGCVGVIEGEASTPVGAPAVSDDAKGSGARSNGAATPGAAAAVPIACDPALAPASAPRLRRLTAAQWSNTVAALGATAGSVPNPFDDGLGDGRFSTEVSRVGVPAPSLTLLLDAAEQIADELAPKLAKQTPCLAAETLEQACVEGALAELGARAFRRPLTGEELGRYAGLVLAEQGAAGAAGALRLGLAALLASPHFAFRWERGGAPDASGRAKLTPHELASAIAYTLTDAPPDAALLAAAAGNQLGTREQVEAHARRLLGDGRRVAAVKRFFQEMFRYPLAKGVFKDGKTFPFHAGELLVEDTDLFVEEAVAARRSFLAALLASDRGVARAGTAASYGVTTAPAAPAPVTFPPGERAGILTQPSFLVAFSDADRSHPIARGKLVSDVLLCKGLVFPTTEVPPLPASPDTTVREKLAVHRQDPACNACHEVLDPTAVALEQYDHTGRHRTTAEGGKRVDASGVLVGAGAEDGPFSGPVELGQKLARSPVVEDCFVRQSFRYWLGRAEEPRDGCVLAGARAAYTRGQGDAVALFLSVLTSDSFLYRRP